MVHTVELNWGKPYIIHRHLFLCQILCLQLCLTPQWQHVNLLHFRH